MNKKIIAIIIAIIIVFLGIFTFANSNEKEKDTTDNNNQNIIENENEDDEIIDEEEKEEPEETTNYTSATRVVLDETAPVITLNGEAEVYIDLGTTYQELGALVTDNKDSDKNATISGSVDNTKAGIYNLTYSATDTAGNQATIVTRTVYVRPLITVLATKLNHIFGNSYVEQQAGFSSDLSQPSTIIAATSSNVDPNTVGGPYYVRFNASANGVDAVEKVIEVMVIDEEKPEITSIVKDPEVEWSNTIVKVTVNASDDDQIAEYGYSFDNGGSWQKDNFKDFDVTSTFNVLVKDKSGNLSDAQEVNVKIDTNEPTIESNVTEPIQAGVYNREAMLGFITTEDLESGVNLASITYSGEDEDYTFDTLGAVSVNYLVKDNAGNESSLAVSFNVIDTQGPNCQLEKSPNVDWTNDHFTLKVTASDNYGLNFFPYNFGNGYEIFENWTIYNTKDYYNEGVRTIDVKVRDLFFNETTCSIEIKIDKTVPTITSHNQSNPIMVQKRLYTVSELITLAGVQDNLSGVDSLGICYNPNCNYSYTGKDFSQPFNVYQVGQKYEMKLVVKDKAGNEKSQIVWIQIIQ